jgi:Protein of unknown function (DUF3108)
MGNIKPRQTKHWLALLVTLFVIVLIAHLAIITSTKGRFSAQKSTPTAAFTTRIVELPVVAPMVQEAPAAVTVQKLPSKVVRPKPVRVPVPADTARSAPVWLPEPIEPTVVTLAPPTEQLLPAPVDIGEPAPEAAQAAPMQATTETTLPPPAFTALGSGRHTYKALFTQNANITQGKAEVLWQQDGEKYALSLTASWLMFEAIAWKSAGLMAPQGLQPERFSDKRFRRSEVAAHFDRNQGKIIFSTNTPEAQLEPTAQDRISIIWQLAGLLAAEPTRYPPGTTLSAQAVDATEAQTWLFTVNEPETLNLDNGAQIALRLTRNPRREFDRKVELWFAPELGYLPVRFRQTHENGNAEDLLWQSTQALPKALSR